MSDVEIKSGWVHKCGKTVKSWKRRWFVLKPNGYLYYYEDKNCKTEKGKIDVVDATLIAPWGQVPTVDKIPSSLSTSHAFAIVTDHRTFTCVCESDGESESWIQCLNKARGGDQDYPEPTFPKEEQPQKQEAPPLIPQMGEAPPSYTPAAATPPGGSQGLPMPQPQLVPPAQQPPLQSSPRSSPHRVSYPPSIPPPYQAQQRNAPLVGAPAPPPMGAAPPPGGPNYTSYPVGHYPPPVRANTLPHQGYAPPPKPYNPQPQPPPMQYGPRPPPQYARPPPAPYQSRQPGYYPPQPRPAYTYPQHPRPAYPQQPRPAYPQQPRPAYPQQPRPAYPQQPRPYPVMQQQTTVTVIKL